MYIQTRILDTVNIAVGKKKERSCERVIKQVKGSAYSGDKTYSVREMYEKKKRIIKYTTARS